MQKQLLAAAAALALAAGASSANATIYNLSVFDAAFVPQAVEYAKVGYRPVKRSS